MAAAEAEDRLILMAIIGRAQGLNGQMRLQFFGESPELLADYGCFYGADGAEYQLASLSFSGGAPVAAFKGIIDRSQAERLAGVELYIRRSQLPELAEEDSYYQQDLLGLAAFSDSGERLGHVSGLFNFGGGDVLELTLPPEIKAKAAAAGPLAANAPAKALRKRRPKVKKALIPFSKAAVPQVDIPAGRLIINRQAAGLTAAENAAEAEAAAPAENSGAA